MTMAICKARRGGRQGGHLRLDRQHLARPPRRTPCGPGMTCAVLVPQRQDRDGQAGAGARARRPAAQVDGNFDDCLELARKLAVDYPVALVNSVNPVRLQGQKTAAFEIVDSLGDAPDVHCLPVGNAGNISAYWMGYKEYAADGAARGPRGCWASRPPARRRS